MEIKILGNSFLLSDYKIEAKWVAIYFVLGILWFLLEKLFGLHDERIALYGVLSLLFLIPAGLTFYALLMDKRYNFYKGTMNYRQAFACGVVFTLGIAFVSPLIQIVNFQLTSPDYFENAIAYSVESGKMSYNMALSQFNIGTALSQNIMGSLLIGLFSTAFLSLVAAGRRSSFKIPR
jgi:hypothetical protein